MHFYLAQAVLVLVPMALGVTLHAWVQAWVAKRLGDDTAAGLGRLSLNPLVHADWLGTLVVPMAVLLLNQGLVLGPVAFFGWGKVVPVNGGRFTRRISVRRGMLLVAVAGSIANLGLALGAAALSGVVLNSGQTAAGAEPDIGQLFELLVQINIAMVVVHLVPLYPMDGQRLAAMLLPPKRAWGFERFNYRYGRILLVLVLMAVHQPLSLLVHAAVRALG